MNDRTQSEPELRSYVISFKMREPLYKNPYATDSCAGHGDAVPQSLALPFVYLRRPNETGTKAIIERREDGTIELNPKGFEYGKILGFNYGPIPKLEDLKPHHADELWKSTLMDNLVEYGSVRTYKLVSTLNEEILLDLDFRDGRLLRYRVRSKTITSSDWYQVN